MGVPGLYSFLSRNYPKCIYKYENSKSKITNEYQIDTLLIDGNACIHPIARKYYFEKPKVRLTSRSNTSNTIGNSIKTDEGFHKLFIEFIEDLYLRVKPKTFFFGIDGVVNLAKSAEQRKRRFLSASLSSAASLSSSSNNNSFDSTNISVGTPWMKKLNKFLYKEFIKLAFKYPSTRFIFQSYLVNGECEHRLIDYIRKCDNDNEACAIHANDADVIPLMLGLHRKNCYILRDRTDDTVDQCSVIDITKLRNELLENYLPYNDNVSDFDKINSIIFLWYLVGMDFLPRCPSLEIFSGGLEDIAISLHKTMLKYGSIVKFEDNNLQKQFTINTNGLVFWMKEIAKRDIIVIQRKATDQKYVPDPLIIKNMISDTNNIIINEKNYKNDYNKTHFKNIDGLHEICQEYLNGLWWTFEYYTKGTPSWTWYYPHHYSPWINDIAEYIESDKFRIPKFTLGKPVPEELQLLYILPPKSFKLLPRQLHHLKDKYPEMFPINIIIDKSGTEFEWNKKFYYRLRILNY